MSTEPKHEPSPEEIRQACLKIQRGWSDEERQRRLRCDWRADPIEPLQHVTVDRGERAGDSGDE